MEVVKSVDKKVMDIFDKEYQEMTVKIFGQVEDLWWLEKECELDVKTFSEYECFYTQLISKQIQSSGISPKEID